MLLLEMHAQYIYLLIFVKSHYKSYPGLFYILILSLSFLSITKMGFSMYNLYKKFGTTWQQLRDQHYLFFKAWYKLHVGKLSKHYNDLNLNPIGRVYRTNFFFNSLLLFYWFFGVLSTAFPMISGSMNHILQWIVTWFYKKSVVCFIV